MVGEIPLRPTPVGIQWLGTIAWTFELGQDGPCWQRQPGSVIVGKEAGDTIQKRMEEQVQGIRFAVGEGRPVRAMRELGAEEVASGLEAETGNTLGNSCAELEGVVGGDEIVWGEGHAKEGEGEVAVGQGSWVGRGDIQRGSDKTMEMHGEEIPSEGFLEEDAGEKTGCMKVGRGEHVEVEVEGDRLGVRLGKHSGSEFRSKERRSRGGQL